MCIYNNKKHRSTIRLGQSELPKKPYVIIYNHTALSLVFMKNLIIDKIVPRKKLSFPTFVRQKNKKHSYNFTFIKI